MVAKSGDAQAERRILTGNSAMLPFTPDQTRWWPSRASIFRTRVALLALGLALSALAAWGQELLPTPTEQKPNAGPIDDSVRTFLGKHCAECHGKEKVKGNFRLNRLGPDFTDKTN